MMRACAIAGLLWGWTIAAAAQAPSSAPESSPPAESLSSRQEALALRYQRFETTLLQLAEYMRKTDPDRAELLVRALGKSKETRIPEQLGEIVKLLAKDQLGDAIDGQEHVVAQMQLVLLLLQSEDRQDELEKEKQRINALIKDVERLIGKQTEARAATERRAPADQLGKQQGRVADDTGKLIDKIDAQDKERAAQQSDKSSDKPQVDRSDKSQDKPREDGDQKPNEGAEPKEGAKPESPSKPGESSSPQKSDSPKSDQGKPSDSQSQPQQDQSPMPGESQSPQEGQQSPQQGQKSPPQTPGRQELQRAKEEMEQAIKELEQKQHNKASDSQDQAIAELHKAKERLEEILRQLREEEKELMLAALESRFRDMLARQLTVYNGTVGLAAVPEDQRADKHRSRSIELSRSQDEVALLAGKALTLLKEEGSSVAFPEAVVQIRDDMLTSARRLERVDVGEITQGIQKDIIESLEEILDALQKELEKSKDKKQQPQQQQPQQQQDQALVDMLAELKMLRSLQYRVNRRTKQLGRLVEGEQAHDPDVFQQLQQLSTRQAKIQQTAADLATGKNR